MATLGRAGWARWFFRLEEISGSGDQLEVLPTGHQVRPLGGQFAQCRRQEIVEVQSQCTADGRENFGGRFLASAFYFREMADRNASSCGYIAERLPLGGPHTTQHPPDQLSQQHVPHLITPLAAGVGHPGTLAGLQGNPLRDPGSPGSATQRRERVGPSDHLVEGCLEGGFVMRSGRHAAIGEVGEQ